MTDNSIKYHYIISWIILTFHVVKAEFFSNIVNYYQVLYRIYLYMNIFRVTVKITGLRNAAGKTSVWPVNLLYIIMFKIRKIKPNSGLVRPKLLRWCQSPKAFTATVFIPCLIETSIMWKGVSLTRMWWLNSNKRILRSYILITP